jgi:DNA modification methylase/succinate dehydrogenase flavin-adding protein (antitoxin of CptAB toxin-antitoxin module)
MMREFFGGKVVLHGGDCLDVLDRLPDNTSDGCVTDPPYHLASIVKRFGKKGAAGAKDYSGERPNATGAFARSSRGFMGKEWDGGDVAFRPETWAKVLRVLKPGAHLVAFAAPKNVGHLQVAIEAAGFETRDCLLDLIDLDPMLSRFVGSLNDAQRAAFFRLLDEADAGGLLAWVFGSGFPKSHDIAKAIDKARDEDEPAVRAICRAIRAAMDAKNLRSRDLAPKFGNCHPRLVDHWAARDTDSQPALPTMAQWRQLRDLLDLAPDLDAEVARLNARKGEPSDDWKAAPVVGEHDGMPGGFGDHRFTVRDKAVRELSLEAQQWAGYGTALKPAFEPIVLARKPIEAGLTIAENCRKWGTGALNIDGCRIDGRFPANVLHDGSAAAVSTFPDTAPAREGKRNAPKTTGVYGEFVGDDADRLGHSDAVGSAARFFYSAKADDDDRLGSKHPTVKPVDLMRYLVRLVTRPGQTVLDLFAGTGTTGEAAWREGRRAVLIEREAEYQADIARRMALCLAGPEERARATIKEKLKDKPVDAGPLFGGEVK